MTEIYSQAALNLLGEIVQISMRVDGLSLASFAQLTNTHKTTIERLTKGEVKDPVPVLRKIAEYIHLVELKPHPSGVPLISKVHLLEYFTSWRDLELILESQSGRYQGMPIYCAVSQRIRDAIAAKGLDPNSESAIEQFAKSGPWSKNLQRLKNIVLGQVHATRDDVAAIAYTLSKFSGELVSPDDIVKLLHQHHNHHESGDCVNSH
ncbi:MAG TPA: helix-turn-helix transcriptional regulator [Allocoleopsis sp.]